jgi:hypothetical protein
MIISDPVSPKKNLDLRQPKNNQNQMNTTRGQNLKEFNNTADIFFPNITFHCFTTIK